MSSSGKNRESSFELLRIVAQWMIVLYHLLFYNFYPLTGFTLYKAVWLPLHVGVIIYVLISGYFGIHASIKGFTRLIIITAFYSVPLALYSDYENESGLCKTLSDLLFISRTPLWFIRTYLFLYLLSPIVNKVIENRQMTLYLISVLLFVSIYIGTVGNDPSIRTGKDVLNFVLIYTIGKELCRRKDWWLGWKTVIPLLYYAILNVSVVLGWYVFNNHPIGNVIWKMSFPYHSPILLLNAVLLFILFGKMKFKSSIINTIAGSAFAVYLIHSHPFIRTQVLAPICKKLVTEFDNYSALPMMILLFSLFVLLASVAIDKALTPFWNIARKGCDSIDCWINNRIIELKTRQS